MNDPRAIGIFDSGMGGITVLARVRCMLPNESIIYWADSANCPYGPRTAQQITALVDTGVRQLIAMGVKAIIIACNTATTVAIAHLRATYKEIPFIGLEPAVKPAIALSKSNKIIVLATRATLNSAMFTAACQRHGSHSTIIPIEGRGLVEIIEQEQQQEPRTQQIVDQLLSASIASGADTIVLACTHYPLLMTQIRHTAGPHINIIDPAEAVARRTEQVLEQHNINAPNGLKRTITYHSSAGEEAAAAIKRRSERYSETVENC